MSDWSKDENGQGTPGGDQRGETPDATDGATNGTAAGATAGTGPETSPPPPRPGTGRPPHIVPDYALEPEYGDLGRRSGPPPHERAFNLPGVVVALVAIFAAVHALRMTVLSPDADFELLLRFSFIPLRYQSWELLTQEFPGGLAAGVWSFVTYGFLHGSLVHLAVNSMWLIVFGSAVARRFGTLRFLAFSAITAAAGAALHLALHFGEPVPVVGASAAISAYMAAAARFVFAHGGPLAAMRAPDELAYRLPAEPLSRALTNRRAMAFIGIWFALNLLFGLGGAMIPGQGGLIAWEAHVGGFLAGLLLFRLFDPVPPARG